MTAWLIAAWYALASVAAFVVFAWDKAAAVSGNRRVPERTLHALSALGGWPGSICAMVLLRHKVRKPGFVVLSGLCAAVHVGAWVAVMILKPFG